MRDDLTVFRDRVRARIELATSSLQATTAEMVKLASFDDAELARAACGGGSAGDVSDHVEALASASTV